MKKGGLPPELIENKECEGCKLFDDPDLLEVWRDPREGISFVNEEGNILQGAIDNVLIKDHKLIVLDYKTRGYALKENTHKYYQNQLDIYTFLLEKNGFDVENYGFLLFYVPKEVLETGEVVFDTTLIKMPVDIQNAERIWETALRLLNGPCPNMENENCVWCKLLENN